MAQNHKAVNTVVETSVRLKMGVKAFYGQTKKHFKY